MKSLALLTHSTDKAVDKSVLLKIAEALSRQLVDDYGNVWQSRGVPVYTIGAEKDAPDDSVLVTIFDDSSDVGILGYHDVSPQGRAYAKVFWRPIKSNDGTLYQGDNSLSMTISHEALELLHDPYANLWTDMGDEAGTEEAHELCDRVEGDSYEIDGVSLSNFLGPRAFRNGVGPYDFLSMQKDIRGIKSPWEIRPNGYAIRRTGGPNGRTRSIFGAQYPDFKRELKMSRSSRAAIRGVPEALIGT